MHPLLHILPSVEHLDTLGCWFVFLSSFLETLVGAGAIYPGSFVVIFFGYLVSQGQFDFIDLIWFSGLGAILGDNISFFLGTKGTHLFKNENKLLRKAYLEKGERFFERHGSKSVFLARFIGPMGSIVPFIAGLSKMNYRTFLFWSVTSGFTWALVHLSIGYFFGDTFLQY